MYCRERTLDDSRREKNDCDWASTTSKNWRCTIFSPGAGWRTFPRIYFIRRCAVVSATYVRPPPPSAHYTSLCALQYGTLPSAPILLFYTVCTVDFAHLPTGVVVDRRSSLSRTYVLWVRVLEIYFHWGKPYLMQYCTV
jgi:hypothetical protein